MTHRKTSSGPRLNLPGARPPPRPYLGSIARPLTPLLTRRTAPARAPPQRPGRTALEAAKRHMSRCVMVRCASREPLGPGKRKKGAECGADAEGWWKSKEHLSVAHFASSPALGHKSCVVAALIARVVACSDFRLASHVSHSRTERHLSLASQHITSVAAGVVQICKSCPGPLHRRERARMLVVET